MVCAWYMDDSDADRRLEHHKQPPKFVSLDNLFATTGVEYFKINHQNCKTDATLKELREKRGYIYEDELSCSKQCIPNYEEEFKNFYTEHLHTYEEIHLILDGSGYFDVRDKNDQWIRIEVTPDDLLILPIGIYHRFTLDTNEYIRAKRYFTGKPIWTSYNRPAENLECRKQYLNRMEKSFK